MKKAFFGFAFYLALFSFSDHQLYETPLFIQHLTGFSNQKSEINPGNLYACPRCNGRRVPPAGPRKGPANPNAIYSI